MGKRLVRSEISLTKVRVWRCNRLVGHVIPARQKRAGMGLFLDVWLLKTKTFLLVDGFQHETKE